METYWRTIVDNNLKRINYELGTDVSTPETEEDAKELYHQWLSSLAERGEDL